MWRRMSGGLSPERQAQFWEFAKPHLGARVPSKPPKNFAPPKGPKPEGIEEMVRAAAAMEHLEMPEKTWLGDLICERLAETKSAGGPWAWSLGRIGARIPLYGSAHQVVPPQTAVRWIGALLSLGLKKADGSAFAVAQMARATNDRLRNIDDSAREKILSALRGAEAHETWIQMVSEVTELKSADEARVLGDSLPIGLQLARSENVASSH
jgi:hypothetical protein